LNTISFNVLISSASDAQDERVDPDRNPVETEEEFDEVVEEAEHELEDMMTEQ
jgi:hypothetical protein